MAYVQRMSETLLASETAVEDRLQRLFATETDEFGLEHAFFSHVDTDAGTQRFDVVHGARGDLTPDNTVPLSTSYCRKTLAARDGTLAVSDALAEGWGDDPAYERFDLGSYLGTTVTVDDDLCGTLCYANTAPRPDPITDEEMRLVELQSRWLGFLLEREAVSPPHGPGAGAFETWDPSSRRLDSVMNALQAPERRLVLSALVDAPTGTSPEAIARRVPREDADVPLYHEHLPKLAAEGYIEWDPDARTLSRGPNFDDVEPLVRLLRHHTDDPPA